MKVRLTEGQLHMIQLLKEGSEIAGAYQKKMGEINDEVNRIFNVLTFTTIAEIVDGDRDVGEMKMKVEAFENIIYKYEDKLVHFFNNEISDEEYSSQWSDVERKLDSLRYKLNDKITDLLDLIDKLESIAESDINDSFKDNKPIEIPPN